MNGIGLKKAEKYGKQLIEMYLQNIVESEDSNIEIAPNQPLDNI